MGTPLVARTAREMPEPDPPFDDAAIWQCDIFALAVLGRPIILFPSFLSDIYCVCLIRYRVMKFVIRAKSAKSSPLQVEGIWTLEAANREEAVSLMEQHIRLLAEGATWTIRPWTPDDSEASDSQSDSALHPLPKPTAAA